MEGPNRRRRRSASTETDKISYESLSVFFKRALQPGLGNIGTNSGFLLIRNRHSLPAPSKAFRRFESFSLRQQAKVISSLQEETGR